MKYHQSIFLLLIAPLFLSSSIKKNRQLGLVTEDEWSRNISSGADFLLLADISIADTRIVEGNSGQDTPSMRSGSPTQGIRHLLDPRQTVRSARTVRLY